jgi:hypothetical protein
MGQGLWLPALVYASGEGGLIEAFTERTRKKRVFEMECLPGFARSLDGLAIARRTAEMVAETREAIRQSQQTIDETRELMRRLDLVIERERVLKRT